MVKLTSLPVEKGRASPVSGGSICPQGGQALRAGVRPAGYTGYRWFWWPGRSTDQHGVGTGQLPRAPNPLGPEPHSLALGGGLSHAGGLHVSWGTGRDLGQRGELSRAGDAGQAGPREGDWCPGRCGHLERSFWNSPGRQASSSPGCSSVPEWPGAGRRRLRPRAPPAAPAAGACGGWVAAPTRGAGLAGSGLAGSGCPWDPVWGKSRVTAIRATCPRPSCPVGAVTGSCHDSLPSSLGIT